MELINREVYPAATSVSAKHHLSGTLPHLLLSYLLPQNIHIHHLYPSELVFSSQASKSV